MDLNLKGKNILVTGSGRGIGAEIARLLAKCGAKVAVHYHKNSNRANEVANDIGRKAILFQADLTNSVNVAVLMSDVIKKFGQLHAVINNAGIAIPSDPDQEGLTWIDEWLQTMDVNLNAPALICKLAIDHFKQIGGGRIVNITSRAAFRGDTKDYLAYAASKGGLVSLTRSIAKEYGKHNIIAFNVAPGFVQTDMAKGFADKYGEEYIKRDIALNELTTPQDIAPIVAFLISGLADHATGGTFDINAGSYFH